jgi:methylenetetrahydrofolate dehydrogenase (NADP+)/methenyltetrahydrofolate cyclohydrolase
MVPRAAASRRAERARSIVGEDQERARIIDGAAYAAGLRGRLAQRVAALKEAHGLTPGLGAVLVGDDPASRSYVGAKMRAAREAGLLALDHRLAATVAESELLALIARLNADPQVHGILVQLPLPPQIDAERFLAAIDPAKDVDGLHEVNAGRLAAGRPGLVPCTPLGCMMLLRHALGDLAGREAIVIGRSALVGRPLALLLLAADCTVTVAHSRSRDLPALCRGKEILVAAIGRPETVRGSWLSPGATVIDVGINRIPRDGKSVLVGDVAFAEAVRVAGAITPVPGGVGPMTVACLIANTVKAACLGAGLAIPPEAAG